MMKIDIEKRVINQGSIVTFIVKNDSEKVKVIMPAMMVLRFAPAGSEGETKCIDFRGYFDPSAVMEKVRVVSEMVERKK